MPSDDDKVPPAGGRAVPPLTERRAAFALKQARAGKGIVPAHFAGLRPMGTGDDNRHGMPRLPPGQREVKDWPILDLGVQPTISRADWRLEIDGLVDRPRTGAHAITFDALLAFPQLDDDSDFHCVTTWSRMNMKFVGVRLLDVLDTVGVRDGATHLLIHAYDEDPSSGEHYTTNVPLAEAVKPYVLLVHTWEGQPLPREHGGPVRMITPQLYAWKGAKWVRRIEVLDRDVLGFWERRGYSNTAIPWFDDRYSRR